MGNHEQVTHVQRTERIATLNDRLRQTHRGGRVMVTPGVTQLPIATVGRVLDAIAEFKDFDPRYDRYHEHDFGRVEVDGHEVFFKIDCYGLDLDSASPDPADETVTARIMVVMLPAEV